MKKEIVWIFGQSAAGKQTFIHEVLRSPRLCQQFGWDHIRTTLSKASIDYIGQYEGDPIRQKRSVIENEVVAALKNNDVALIKWQYEDSQTRRIQSLKDKLPDVRHRIIVLALPKDEYMKRLRSKPWWNPEWDMEDFISDEIRDVNAFIRDTDIHDMLFVDSSTDDYPIVKNMKALPY